MLKLSIHHLTIFRSRALFVICFFSLINVTGQSIDKNYLLGKFEPSEHLQFVKISDEHGQGSAKGGYLRKETYEAFVRMHDAAIKDGVDLIIISATRNFESQKRIWENKWEGRTNVEGINLTTIEDPKARAKLILLYSSMPSTSRHHWGTDMDLNSLENSSFESGKGLKIYRWLTAHAAEYGFCQPYTSKTGGRTGYEEEKWHWSYLPLSDHFLEEYIRTVTYKDIKGFAGSNVASSIEVIRNYVQGVTCIKK